MLAIDLFVLILFVISRLDLSQAEPLSRFGQSTRHLLGPVGGKMLGNLQEGLRAEVMALGGRAVEIIIPANREYRPSLPDLPPHSFEVILSGPATDDDALAPSSIDTAL